jgi:N-acetyl-gamma-glutamyl-phosphate reductase
MSGRVAIVGASGYTGAELIRLLLGHPRARVAGLYARRAAGSNIDEVFPHLAGVSAAPIAEFDPDAVAAAASIAFCALPHGQSARAVAALRERGLLVIDLSADFRLRDSAVYDAWYGSTEDPTHPAPGLLADAVYGLPERYRADLAGAKLIAAPGCYPTSAILAAAPLLDAKLIRPERLIVDAKSGVSGAGRSPGMGSHFPEIGEGVRAYKVGGTHRHTPEIEQELSRAAGAALQILFTPHLIPMTRGIFTCVYAEPVDPARSEPDYQAALEAAYADEPFVIVLPSGRVPDTAHVRGSNRAHVAVTYDPRTQRVLCMAAIDNLVKGASGQAIQAMNLALGWDETLGLGGVGVFP